MAGTLTISTLSDGANSTSSTNCIQGSAKAWVNWNGYGAASIRASYNVSSVTYVGAGNYVVNYTNAFADANYVVTLAGRRYNSDSNFGVQLRGAIMSGGALYSTTQTAVTSQLPNAVSAADGDIMCLAAFR